MRELSREARNSVTLQADLFMLAKRDHALSLAVLERKTGIPRSTLAEWRDGTPIPAWALFTLGRKGGIPDDLLSMLGEPFCRHIGTDEDGDGDLDTAADDADELASAVRRARSPHSPGGVAIVPQERAEILPLVRKTIASGRKAARA